MLFIMSNYLYRIKTLTLSSLSVTRSSQNTPCPDFFTSMLCSRIILPLASCLWTDISSSTYNTQIRNTGRLYSDVSCDHRQLRWYAYGYWSLLSVSQNSRLSSVMRSCNNFNASTWMSVRGKPSTKTPTVGSQSNMACKISSMTYLSDIIWPWFISSLHSGVWSNWDTEMGGFVMPRARKIEGVWVPFPDLYKH